MSQPSLRTKRSKGQPIEEYAEGVDDSDRLLNLSKRCYPSKLLAWHYRSKYEELINFSNHAFYGGQVQIAPNVTPRANPPAIEWISVDGLWENNCNELEAHQVVGILKQIFKNYPGKTVGVITFNSKQQEKIQDFVDQLAEEDVEFNALYSQVMSREIDARVFVKNIENVQGDERDIIIFSIAYGRNLQGRVSANFGTLNRQGGENRLNVAVSRGKEKVIVVSSIRPEDIDVGNSKNLGPVLFKQYLRYAYAVANKDQDTVTCVLQEVNQSQQSGGKSEGVSLSFDSPFEEEVHKYLTARGYTVDTQIGCSGYRIDLAVIHPQESTRYILGIECDGAMYHSARSARERDIYRQRFLESKGWNISRIWSRNWWQNPEKEINKIEGLLQELSSQTVKSEFQIIQATDEGPDNIGHKATAGLTHKQEPYRPKVIKIEPRIANSGKPAEVVELKSKQQGHVKIMQPVIATAIIEDTSELFMQSMQMYNMSSHNERKPLERLQPKNKRTPMAETIEVTSLNGLSEMKIGVLVRRTLTKMLTSHEISEEEIALMQKAEYSKQTFDIQFPLLRKASLSNGEKILRYWAGAVEAYGEKYFICSEWYEVPQNNDRPHFLKWLALHK